MYIYTRLRGCSTVAASERTARCVCSCLCSCFPVTLHVAPVISGLRVCWLLIVGGSGVSECKPNANRNPWTYRLDIEISFAGSLNIYREATHTFQCISLTRCRSAGMTDSVVYGANATIVRFVADLLYSLLYNELYYRFTADRSKRSLGLRLRLRLRLRHLGLPSLELRLLHLDLIFCYKMGFGIVNVSFSSFFKFSTVTSTRGHQYKPYKSHCSHSTRSRFFCRESH